MPGPQSQPKGGKSKAILAPRAPHRGEKSHNLRNAPKALRKRLAKLTRRRKSYEDLIGDTSGYHKPGSMNLRKG